MFLSAGCTVPVWRGWVSGTMDRSVHSQHFWDPAAGRRADGSLPVLQMAGTSQSPLRGAAGCYDHQNLPPPTHTSLQTSPPTNRPCTSCSSFVLLYASAANVDFSSANGFYGNFKKRKYIKTSFKTVFPSPASSDIRRMLMDIIDLHVSPQWKQLSNHRNKHCCGCFGALESTQEIVYKLISWDERMCAQHGRVILFSEIWAGGMASSTSMSLPWWMEELLRRLSQDLWKNIPAHHINPTASLSEVAATLQKKKNYCSLKLCFILPFLQSRPSSTFLPLQS